MGQTNSVCELKMSLDTALDPPFLPTPHGAAAGLCKKSREEVRKSRAAEGLLQPTLSLAEGAAPWASPPWEELQRDTHDNRLFRGAGLQGSVYGQKWKTVLF